MDAQHTAPFQQLLLTQRESLRAQLAQLRGGALGRAQASAEHYGGPKEDPRAQQESERALEFTLDARESAELDAIEAALQRIAADTYGLCTDCGADIPATRLQAAPEAPRCLQCQTAHEHRPRA